MTDTETTVAQLCRTMLRLATVDVDDDLMQVGGDSLFVVELALEIERIFAIEVPVEALERSVRVRDMAAWIDATRAAADPG